MQPSMRRVGGKAGELSRKAEALGGGGGGGGTRAWRPKKER